jgi:hypothetical protein
MFLIKNVWITVLIPLVIGSFHFLKLSKSVRFIYWFVFFGAITELTNKLFIYELGMKNTMPLGHFYIAVSFIFAGLFYAHELHGFIHKRIIYTALIIYELFCLHNVIFFQSHLSFPSIPGAVSALLVVLFSILLFTKIMIEGKIKVLTRSPVVWVNTAMLVYFTGSFFYNILYNISLNYSVEFSLITIKFSSIFMAVFYLLISVGFWKAGNYEKK